MVTKLIFFSAAWCPYCPAYKSVVEEVAEELGLEIQYVDADADFDLLGRFLVKTLPSVGYVKDEKEFLLTGSKSKVELKSILEEALK